MLVLVNSLKKVKSKYGITVLVSDNNVELYNIVSTIYSADCFVEVVLMKYESTNQTSFFGSSQWKDTFFKLEATGLTQYKKIVLIDIDMLILKNIDELFEYPHMFYVAYKEKSLARIKNILLKISIKIKKN